MTEREQVLGEQDDGTTMLSRLFNVWGSRVPRDRADRRMVVQMPDHLLWTVPPERIADAVAAEVTFHDDYSYVANEDAQWLIAALAVDAEAEVKAVLDEIDYCGPLFALSYWLCDGIWALIGLGSVQTIGGDFLAYIPKPGIAQRDVDDLVQIAKLAIVDYGSMYRIDDPDDRAYIDALGEPPNEAPLVQLVADGKPVVGVVWNALAVLSIIHSYAAAHSPGLKGP